MTHRSGFTFIELIVAMGVFATLVGLATVHLLGGQRTSSLTATTDTLIADIKEQQIKAITGDTAAGSQSSYGVYFGPGQYVLFAGGTYNPTDSTNAVIPLDSNVVFASINFPNTSVVFASGSGEIVNFSSQAHTVTLLQVHSGEGKTIDINRYGVITSVN